MLWHYKRKIEVILKLQGNEVNKIAGLMRPQIFHYYLTELGRAKNLLWRHKFFKPLILPDI